MPHCLVLSSARTCVNKSKNLFGSKVESVQGFFFFFSSSLTKSQRSKKDRTLHSLNSGIQNTNHKNRNSDISRDASGEYRIGSRRRLFASMSTGNDQHLNSDAGDETIIQFSSILSSMKERMDVENKKQCLLWLGSGSQSRKQLLGELLEPLGVGFQTMSADIDEKAIRVPDPRELVVKLAHAKADAILRRMEDEGVEKQGFLLTCDQVVVHEDEILEKPETEEEARRFIDGYGRSPASTVGSVVCTNLENGKRVETVDVATILFRPIPKETVDALVEEGEIFWCAGGLMVEHPLVVPHVVDMQGGIDSVMGLKKDSVVRLVLEAAL